MERCLVRAALHVSASTAPRGYCRVTQATHRQRRHGWTRHQYEHYRDQAPDLPAQDPYGEGDFNLNMNRHDPDVVHGLIGLVARQSGIIGQRQLDNAKEVMERRIETYRLRGVQVLQRDLGKLTPVTRTSLISRLPAHLRQLHSGSQGKVNFSVHTVLGGTVVFELHTQDGVCTADSSQLLELLHAGAMQIGLSVVPCPKGVVDCFDDRGADTSFWMNKRNTGLFRRSQTFVPENSELLDKSRGVYKLGTPLPRPLRGHSAKKSAMFRTKAESKEFNQRYEAQLRATQPGQATNIQDVAGRHKFKHRESHTGSVQRRLARMHRRGLHGAKF
eukprot:TRINITY_DN59756_c0_g1_i1.p1 TRINITY_DN59756_c0_g1~~TRINITY_DN59756_c0_g1_i1.p1  ORF type:complete len:341 (+),score=55.53 TRINITY_DN59756_c0_g1_i1:32-1024(+)